MSDDAQEPREVAGKSFAFYGAFAFWPAYHGAKEPGGVVRALGGRVVHGTQRVDEDLDFLVLGDKRGKGRAEAKRRGERLVEAGGKLRILDEATFRHLVRLNVTGKTFAFAGACDFCYGGLEEAQPPALVAALGGVPVEEVAEALDFLVVGKRRGKGKAAKVRAAETLNLSGASIAILDEAGFLDLIKAEAPPSAVGSSGDEFPTFLVRLQSLVDPKRITRALKMLKKQSFQLYNDVGDEQLVGIVGSQTTQGAVYSSMLRADGSYSCADGDLGECMGLQGSICKHLLVLLIGLTRTGALGYDVATAWVQAGSRKRPLGFKKAEDELAATLLRYRGAQAGEIDWRPTETLPEDFMAF